MAKLTAKKRKALPAEVFAGPGHSYPVPDASHAAVAKGRATQQVNAGHLTASAAARIRSKANKILGGRQ
jgi:hypothetical protein